LFVLTAVAGWALCAAALAQAPEPREPAVKPATAASELADALTRRIGEDLGVKAVVGKPVTAGSVTLIPILMIDINFGGAGLVSAGGPPPAPAKEPPGATAPPAPRPGADGFLMSGEARPLGFVVVTRQGTRFLSVAPPPEKRGRP
jgi:uncharacterized spore protein YtfJ